MTVQGEQKQSCSIHSPSSDWTVYRGLSQSSMTKKTFGGRIQNRRTAGSNIQWKLAAGKRQLQETCFVSWHRLSLFGQDDLGSIPAQSAAFGRVTPTVIYTNRQRCVVFISSFTNGGWSKYYDSKYWNGLSIVVARSLWSTVNTSLTLTVEI